MAVCENCIHKAVCKDSFVEKAADNGFCLRKKNEADYAKISELMDFCRKKLNERNVFHRKGDYNDAIRAVMSKLHEIHKKTESK